MDIIGRHNGNGIDSLLEEISIISDSRRHTEVAAKCFGSCSVGVTDCHDLDARCSRKRW
jgi:hypothetical protein